MFNGYVNCLMDACIVQHFNIRLVHVDAGIVKAVPCGLTYIYVYRLKISLCYANERVYDRNQVNLYSLVQRLIIPWIVK